MNDGRVASERSEISGESIDDARAMYEDAYNGTKFLVEPTEERFHYRYTSVGDAELSLRGSLFMGHVRGSIVTQGEYVVSWLTAGEGATDLAGDAQRLQHGVPAMFVNDRPAEFDFANYRQNLMHFDAGFLERVAAEHEGVPEAPLLFDATATPSAEALRRWASTVSTAARVLHDDTAPQLLREEAKRVTAVTLLETFPHESIAVPPELKVPNSSRLRLAIEYMHANAHLPINADQIAEAAGTSTRTVQSAFRNELGLTPVDYLRRIRLDRVRAELQAGETGRTTVAEIAGRWGFAHLGRFAAHYAERFGEQPRATLTD